MRISKALFSSLSIAFALSSALLMQSCKSDTGTTPTLTEFIADSASFKGYMSWSLDKVKHGPDPLLGAMAHGGNDTSVTREIFFKNGQKAQSSVYPIGTLIAKYAHNPAGTANMVTAMAKRGNNFSPGKGDWEYFVLNMDGTIAIDDASGMPMRGASLMGGMCAGCHSAATTDYVFSK